MHGYASPSQRAKNLPLGFVALLLAAILVFAPLFRSGQPPLAQLVLELASVCLLVIILWTPQKFSVDKRQALILGFFFLTPFFFLIPLPFGLIESLPGREFYGTVLTQIGARKNAEFWSLSLVPFRTEAAWLLTLVPIAVFLGTRSLNFKGLRLLVILLLGMVTGQAILGLLQYGGRSDLLYLGMEQTRQTAVGTYTNRNHLAGLLAMTLPIALALLFYSIGRRDHRPPRWRKKIAFLASMRGHTAIGYGAIALLLLLAIIFTRSRAGIALAMLGILLATFAFSRRIGGTNIYGTIGTIVTITIGIGLVIGLAPVLDRFSISGTIEDARWAIFSATTTGIGYFFPLGSGPGSFSQVFNAFQPLELGRWFVNHAHNDYLEWLFEGGAFAASLILLFIALYLRQWTKVWISDSWSQLRFIRVGAGIGLFLMLGHSLVDYNLHTPANIVYFAFLSGIFFADPDIEEERKRSRRSPKVGDTDIQNVSQPQPVRITPQVAPDQIRNPFLD